MIRVMKTRVPPILAKRAPAKPNVVACAIAMSRGERFESDAQALDIFGVAPRTDVRELWEAKLAELIDTIVPQRGRPDTRAYQSIPERIPEHTSIPEHVL